MHVKRCTKFKHKQKSPKIKINIPHLQHKMAAVSLKMGETFEEINHAKHLVFCLNEYRKARTFCDIVLISPPKEVFAHRNVVCAASPHILERLDIPVHDGLANGSAFGSTHVTSLGSRIEIENVSPDVIEDIVNFMYIGEICVGEENVRKLIAASDILKMTNLKEISCRFYEKRLCPSNCLSIAALADEFNCDTLRQAADKFILEHFLEVCRYSEFQTLSCSHLVSIISSDDINAEGEEQILSAAMDWIHHDLLNRKQHLSTILKATRLLLLSKYFIVDVLEQDEIIMSDPECSRVIKDIKYILTFPDRKHIYKFQNAFKPRAFSDVTDIIIACGGNQERISSNEVLCYVPSQDFWYPLAPLMKSRYLSSSVVLNNELYCIGGKYDGLMPIKNIERYSFATDKWIESSPFPSPIYGHVSCVFNGEIYVIGGGKNDTASNTVMKYSPERGVWIQLRNMLVPRRLAAVAVHKQLYMIGGYGPDNQAMASVERYDPYSNQWAKIFPMNSPRALCSACCVEDNIFVFGGEYATWSYYRSAEVFNIKTDEWLSIADFSIPRADMGVIGFQDQIFLIGGMVSAEGQDQYGVDDEEEFVDVAESNIVECYNTTKRVWQTACSLPVATAGANCVVISTSRSVLSQRCGF